jgi:micrococcal nuclease
MWLKLGLLVTAVGLSACAGHQVSLSVQSPATLQQEPTGFERAVVTRVVDGDTIEVLITGRVEGPGAGLAEVDHEYDVRLVGIDTPESVKPGSPVECFGKEASAALHVFLDGRHVRLVDDVEEEDGYGRILRYVYLGAEMANARLVANGYASVYTYPPNVRHASLFVQLQREARENDLGLWSPETCNGPT